MDKNIQISFQVTPSQKETIDLRMAENGFDDITSYLRVVALKTQAFKFTSPESTNEESSIELSFQVTPSQNTKIEENIKESNCEDIASYMRYVALHSVVTAVVEVRSTGDLDSMLKRIAKSRNSESLNKAFLN